MSRLSRGFHPPLPLGLLILLLAGCSDAAQEDGQLSVDGVLHDLRRPAAGSTSGDAPLVLVRVASRPGEHRFEPAEVRLAAGGIIRFVMTGNIPDAVVFDSAAMPGPAREYLRERSLVHGPLLGMPGQTYDVDLSEAPAGRYRFESLLHSARGMVGVVELGDAAEAAPSS